MEGSDPEVDTAAGTLVFVVLPVPNCPERLRPQQYAAPEVDTPHVWLPPGATFINKPDDAPSLTRTGAVAFPFTPLPLPPAPPEPQQ